MERIDGRKFDVVDSPVVMGINNFDQLVFMTEWQILTFTAILAINVPNANVFASCAGN